MANNKNMILKIFVALSIMIFAGPAAAGTEEVSATVKPSAPAAAPAPEAKSSMPAPVPAAVPASAPATQQPPAQPQAVASSEKPSEQPKATYSEEDVKKLVETIKKNNVIEEETLPEGIKIIFKKNTSSDIIVVRLALKAGSIYETTANNGISALTFELLKKGTKTMNAEQIARAIEQTGASFESSVSKFAGELLLVSTVKSFEKNFDILADCTLNPIFDNREVEKEKQFLTGALKAENDKMDAACSKLFYKTMFEGHPYALYHLGTIESIGKINRQDIVKWHKTLFAPENMTFVVVGNTDKEFIKNAIIKRFGMLKKSAKTIAVIEDASKKIAAGAPAITAPREARELKDKAQCFIYLGYQTEGVESKDYGALKMIATVLGSGMSSRLFSILRDKESLAYQVTGYYQTLRGNSAIITLMGTRKENYDKAVAGLKREIDRFRTELITEEEYARAKNKLIGSYALQRNTMAEQATFLSLWDSLGLGASFENKYLENVLSPTREDIQKAAQKYFDPNKFVLTVIYPEEKKDAGKDKKPAARDKKSK